MPGVRISGNLDCTGAKLNLEHGEALIAEGAEIGGNVVLRRDFALNRDFISYGKIDLDNARIGGNLDCSGASLEVKEGDTLSAAGAEIGGCVFLRRNFESCGTIRLTGAKIKNNLDCSGAKIRTNLDCSAAELKVREEEVLIANRAEIGGSVFLRQGFESSSKILLSGARINGNLVFLGAKAIVADCRNLRLTGDLFWTGIQEPGKSALNLTGASVKNLRDDKKSWPEARNLSLDGLVYEEVTLQEWPSDDEIKRGRLTKELELNVEERIAWLMLQPAGRCTEAQPWMQLRDLLNKKGDRNGAKYVLRRFRWLRAQNCWILWRWWRGTFAWLEENPFRIGYSIIFTLVLGTLIFAGAIRSGAMTETIQTQPSMIASYEEAITKPTLVKPLGANKPVSLHYMLFQPFIWTVPTSRFGHERLFASRILDSSVARSIQRSTSVFMTS
jgi:hypothetical protein